MSRNFSNLRIAQSLQSLYVSHLYFRPVDGAESAHGRQKMKMKTAEDRKTKVLHLTSGQLLVRLFSQWETKAIIIKFFEIIRLISICEDLL